jgi:hypothetical protein
MSKVARHPRHPAVLNMSLEEIAQNYSARFAEIKPDWNVFNDGVQPVFLQVMVGQIQPEPMGYTDPDLYAKQESQHTRA